MKSQTAIYVERDGDQAHEESSSAVYTEDKAAPKNMAAGTRRQLQGRENLFNLRWLYDTAQIQKRLLVVGDITGFFTRADNVRLAVKPAGCQRHLRSLDISARPAVSTATSIAHQGQASSSCRLRTPKLTRTKPDKCKRPRATTPKFLQPQNARPTGRGGQV